MEFVSWLESPPRPFSVSFVLYVPLFSLTVSQWSHFSEALCLLRLHSSIHSFIYIFFISCLQQTALHWSAFYNRPEHVRLLIKHDSNIGIPDSEGKIPLHWAAHSQEASATQTVRCILVNAKGHLYCMQKLTRSAHRLPSDCIYFSSSFFFFFVLLCVKEAAPTESLLNWQDYEGRTPLHFAVADGNKAVVEVLTSYEGCNVTAYDNLFRTPLHWAALLGE